MLFSRVASFFAVSLSLGTLAAASPAPVDSVSIAKRDNASIEAVFTTLQNSTNSILPQITSLASSGNATNETVTPLINDLTSALDAATASLAAMSPTSRVKRQSESDIATLVAGIVTDIANALNSLEATASAIPELGTLFGGVDSSLSQVLLGLEILLSGVLSLVAALLTDVAGLLQQLAFGLTLGALGL